MGTRRAWVLTAALAAVSLLYLVPAGLAAPQKVAAKPAAADGLTAGEFAARFGMRVADQGNCVTLRGSLVTVRLYPGTNQVSVVGDAYTLKDAIQRQDGAIRIPSRPAAFLSQQVLAKRRQLIARREAFKVPEVRVPPPAPRPVRRPAATKRLPAKPTPKPIQAVRPRSPAPDASWAPFATERRWKWIVIHHSDDLEGDADKYDRIHREKNGWDSLGYHFVIGNGSMSKDGEVEVGPRWPIQKHGAHARNHELGDNRYNEEGIGICLVGDFDEDGRRPTSAQMKALVRLTGWLMQRYDIPAHRVLRHCDCCKTQCPGQYFPWEAFQAHLR